MSEVFERPMNRPSKIIWTIVALFVVAILAGVGIRYVMKSGGGGAKSTVAVKPVDHGINCGAARFADCRKVELAEIAELLKKPVTGGKQLVCKDTPASKNSQGEEVYSLCSCECKSVK